MLANAAAVAFIQVRDQAQARAFYEGVLGLPVTQDPHALVARVGDCRLRITALPNWQPADSPAFGFELPDLAPALARLAEHGVPMIRYDFLGDAQGPDGVWTGPDGSQVAWFKDPDGNLLSFSKHAG